MAEVHSVRFFMGLYNTGSTTVYTVPAGFRAVVRSISFSAGGSGLALAQVYIGNVILLQTPSVPANGFTQWHGRQVAYSSETMAVYLQGGGGWVMASGYLLTEVP